MSIKTATLKIGFATFAVVTALLAGWIALEGQVAQGGAGPHLAIDADPGNGSRPCDPIDDIRMGAPTSGSYTVAICLADSAGAPDAFEARLVWSGGVATAPEVADTAPALDDNPNANNGAGPNGLGTSWDCTGFGLAFPKGNDPATAGVNDAYIVCNDTTFGSNSVLTANPGLLATLTMNASGAGTMSFTFDPTSNVNSPAGANAGCAGGACPGAVVVQGTGPAEPTQPPPTPCLIDGQPCPTNTAGPTATIDTRLRTFTPTPVEGGPDGGETPGPGAPTATTTVGGLPDVGGADTGSVELLWVWVAAGLTGIAGAAAAYTAYRRSRHV